MTIGRIVIVSMMRRTFGSRRCTQMTVGTISTRVSTVVIAASRSDSVKRCAETFLAGHRRERGDAREPEAGVQRQREVEPGEDQDDPAPVREPAHGAGPHPGRDRGQLARELLSGYCSHFAALRCASAYSDIAIAMISTMRRARALPTLVCPASTLPFRNEPIWIDVSGMLPLVSAWAVA